MKTIVNYYDTIRKNRFSIFINDEHIFEGFIGEEVRAKFTKEQWADIEKLEVKSTNWYFETFVIRLVKETKQ